MLVLAGCSQGAPPLQGAPAPVEVSPSAFAIQRCPELELGAPCLVVMAGGKTLLFGAPEGAMSALEMLERPVPDAVFVSSLDPSGLEGLSRLRNRSWALGRIEPLVLAGPDGTDILAGRLDEAYARSDAVVYLSARPKGGFDSALFLPLAVPPAGVMRVFDTGDLTVDGLAAPSGPVTWLVRYDGRALQIAPCDGPVTSSEGVPLDAALACDALSDTAAWPFENSPYLLVP